VAAVQYTFTHKQYTEYRDRYIHTNKKKKNWEVRAVPHLFELYPGICLETEEKAWKTSVTGVEKCPDIPVAVVQYTFTHNQYTLQYDETEYTERNIHNNKNNKRTKLQPSSWSVSM
jgi:hypothetical protein